ncbi:hypothetical protein AB0G60_02845 [Streptomyces angustmyceticus]|uniref:Uncharacterized protein n=1 Tax=Streptomyces angustmyceticus TaxID=285578 RepID=A0A5J4L8R1_9ACTN|nr:hypothetical protein [Streptomyces angustmyceticus]UAL65600.1 hypothetical protein K7396_02815 [Streptomyces angustmyceticus]GES27879.1 hypothetical protein San01_03660 [Streptomyces angustmyceticus]
MSTDFPDDLVQLQRDVHAATADYKAFLDAHPEPPEPVDGWRDKPGEGYWRDRQREASDGWSSDDKQRVVELRQRLHELIPQLHGHPHWDTLSGPELVKARMALKHVDDEDTDG